MRESCFIIAAGFSARPVPARAQPVTAAAAPAQLAFARLHTARLLRLRRFVLAILAGAALVVMGALMSIAFRSEHRDDTDRIKPGSP